MKNIVIMAVTLFMLAASMTSRAEEQNINGFVGLWEAVDPDDGSHLILSITNNDDSTVKLFLYDTFFTTCDGRRGIAQGTGKVSAEVVLISDDFTITCFETGYTEAAPTTYTRNSDGTLIEVGAKSLFQNIIYHQTSNNGIYNRVPVRATVHSTGGDGLFFASKH